MWTEIAAYVKANTTETLVISIVGTLFVWIYKQFKDRIDREQQEKITNLQLKQGLFTKLELSIASVLHLNNETSKMAMYTLLGECGPYLTSTQRKIVREYYKNFDPSLLYSLHALIVNEVDKLDRQSDKIRDDKEHSEWAQYISRLYAPIYPMLLFAVIILYVVVVASFASRGANPWDSLNIVLTGITIAISLVLASSFIFFFMKRELGKQGAKRWSAIVLLILSPSLTFVIGRFEMSILALIVQAAVLVYLSFSKRPPEIVRA